MDLQVLIEQNPWWVDPKRIDEDPQIKEFDNSPVRWVPRIKRYFHLDRDVIYTLRGPRQVGKTTLLKIIIRDLLKEVSPFRILYFTVDMLSDNKELVDLITTYQEYLDGMGVDGRRYILLDEISSVEQWVKAIKYLADTGRLKNSTLILTGSHSLDIKEASERLPGRRGEGDGPVNKIMMPMKFSEYVETLRPDIRRGVELLRLSNEEKNELILKLLEGEVEGRLLSALPYMGELRGLFERYLLTGGVIRPIVDLSRSEAAGEPRIRNEVYEIYVRTVIGDLAEWGFRESVGKRILKAVIRTMATPVSHHAIAKETEIGSHNTVMRYLEGFESSFLLNLFYIYQMDRSMPNYRKAKKIYFSDPFIFHAIRGWAYGYGNYFSSSREVMMDEEWRGRLVEMVAGGHLIRLLYRIRPSDVFTHHENIFYWRGKRGGGRESEVDFVLKHNSTLIPVEVKYRKSIRSEDLRGLKRFGGGILLTHEGDIKVYGKITAIPVELFLSLI